jgi:signal transduction histidine kinase
MDAQMPGLDGFATTKLIKSREASRHVPIIFVTALDREESNVVRGYEHGAVDYLVKPVDPDILRSKVRVFVELHSLRERVRAQGAQLQTERIALAQAQAAVRAREDVLAIVSHDLGNPISAIDALAELVARRGFVLNDPQLNKLAERQHRAVSTMKRLVADLLEASRIESGSLTVQASEQPVAALIRHVMELMLPLAADKEQRLSSTLAPDACHVRCDADRINQVLANLVGNAVKHAPRGAVITISTARDADSVIFSVHDDGPGIAPADLPRLFDRYWRPSGVKHAGVGLGLAIAKGIVNAHGGRIWADSEPGEGCRFSFSLPG